MTTIVKSIPPIMTVNEVPIEGPQPPAGHVKRIHRCLPPRVEGTGDIWRCECGAMWRSIHPGNPAYAGWRRLGPIGRFIHRV